MMKLHDAIELAEAMVAEAAADCGLTLDEVAADMADPVIHALLDENVDADDLADAVTIACGTPRYEVLRRVERLHAHAKAAVAAIKRDEDRRTMLELMRPEKAAEIEARVAAKVAEMRKNR